MTSPFGFEKETTHYFQQGRTIMSNSTLKMLPALMVAITAALVTNTVFGSAITDHQLVFTENSSTSLTVTGDAAEQCEKERAAFQQERNRIQRDLEQCEKETTDKKL
jgi:hypothetical protein